MDIDILLAEEDRAMADAAAQWLGEAGYAVHACCDGLDAAELVEMFAAGDRRRLKLAIVSLSLPGSNGEEICRYIRNRFACPIIMVMAQRDKLDMLLINKMGADDRMIKPYKRAELLGRVREQVVPYLRWLGLPCPAEQRALSVRGLELEREGRRCRVDGREVALTQTEFALLWQLCLTPGKSLPADELFRRVWQQECLDTAANTIMVHIRHLRIKLGDDANPEPYIRTTWREGYSVEP